MKGLTVGELIEILEKYPKDLEVWGEDEGGNYKLTEQDVNYYSYNEDSLGFYEMLVIGFSASCH